MTELRGPLTLAEFAARLDVLGPFEPAPHLAVAVSGGADSTALALLARDWAATHGGRVSGLIVDHGLRAASAGEAVRTATLLAAAGIAPRVLRLEGLAAGSGLAARARIARYAALLGACAAEGILHLLIGHHLADQAETVAMRRHSGSGAAGLAGMAALAETSDTRMLRPLLDVPPVRLRALLRARGVAWVEDPSNADTRALRARLRVEMADPDGTGPEIAGLGAAARRSGMARAERDVVAARWLAAHAEIRPEGYALLDPGPWDPVATASLLRMLGGAPHAPPAGAVARLAEMPRAATLGGVRVTPSGRWRDGGWLLLREEAAMATVPSGAAEALWDGRFRTIGGGVGQLGGAPAVASVGRDALPTAVALTLPALAGCKAPQQGLQISTCCGIVFSPPHPAACAPFAPMQPGC